MNDTSPCSADEHPGCLGIGAFGVNCSYVSEVPPGDLPLVSRLHPNYPNPFNPRTWVEYSVARPGTVSLKIYDNRGRLVRTLVNEHQGTGPQRVLWKGLDDQGRSVASGVYHYVLKANGRELQRKMTLLR